MPRAAIWARVSTSEQETSNQVEVLTAYAERRGFEVVRVWRLEESAWNGRHRQALDEVVRAARQGEFEVLAVWALDRLSREGPLDTLRLLDRLNRAGCAVASYQESWVELSGEMREVFVAITAWVAQFESKRKSERVRAALARRKAAGLPVGRQPGAKDTKQRKRSGYVARYERERAAKESK